MSDEHRGPDPGDEDGDLFADLGRFETADIPVDAVLRQGRAIRVRRRVAGSGALAVAAALSIGVPAAIAGGGGSDSAASGRNGVYGASSSGGRVTVNPTRFADGKGHFSGTVDGKKWSVDFDNKNCYYIPWSCGFPDLYPWDKYASLTSASSQPDDYTLFLNKNVAQAVITLRDGEVLRLAAVPVANVPVVLFASPSGLGISKIELFDARGSEIAYSLPFNIAGAPSAAAHWYKPGEKPPAVSDSVELARGKFGVGPEKTMRAYVGPSGPCIVTQSDGYQHVDCNLAGPVTGSSTVHSATVTNAQGLKGYAEFAASGLVAPNIDHMQLDFTDGTKGPVTIKSLGGYRFFAYFVSDGKGVTGVTAFDSAGKPLPLQTTGR